MSLVRWSCLAVLILAGCSKKDEGSSPASSPAPAPEKQAEAAKENPPAEEASKKSPLREPFVLDIRHRETLDCDSFKKGACGQASHWTTRAGDVDIKDADPKALGALFKKEADRERAPSGNILISERTVLVCGDPAAPWVLVQNALSECARAGIYKISWRASESRRAGEVMEAWLPCDRGNEVKTPERIVLEEIRVFMRLDPRTNQLVRKVNNNPPAANDRELMDVILSLKAAYDAKRKSDYPLLIDPTSDVPWRDVIQILTLCRKAGLPRIEFAAPMTWDGMGPARLGQPRDVFERKGIPKDQVANPTEEPGIFFPEAKEKDHKESADDEDYRQMKEDAKEFLSTVPGESGGFRRRKQDPEELVAKLGSSSFEEQGKAAQGLEEMGPKAIPALEKAEIGDNAQIRDWAVKIKRQIDENGKAAKALIEKLGSDNLEEQGQAAEGLKKMGTKAAPWLEDARKSENKQVRDWVAKILPVRPGVSDTMGVGGGGRYGGRFGGRENLVARGGGTRATESAVLAALKWLARHQSDDGSWSADNFSSKCCNAKCSGPGVKDFDAGVTGLALLAFLGAGYSHLSKDEYPDPACPGKTLKFGEVVKKAIQWCTSHQSQDGCVGEKGPKYMYNHAICALALSEAYGMTGSLILKDPSQRAIDFLVAAQNPGKGWRYSAKCGDNDSSVTGWAVMALKSAELSELNFPRSCYEGALAWYKEVTDDSGYYRVGYTHKGTGKVFVPGKNEDFENHEAMSAAAVMARIFMQKNKREPALGAVNLLINDLPEWKPKKIDYYYWYYSSLALFQYDGPEGGMWKKWNEPMKNALVPNQKTGKDGCLNGSWSAEEDRWGFEGGRVYATAINALTLEVYYRYANVFGVSRR